LPLQSLLRGTLAPEGVLDLIVHLQEHRQLALGSEGVKVQGQGGEVRGEEEEEKTLERV
jgi:hypothetical protein